MSSSCFPEQNLKPFIFGPKGRILGKKKKWRMKLPEEFASLCFPRKKRFSPFFAKKGGDGKDLDFEFTEREKTFLFPAFLEGIGGCLAKRWNLPSTRISPPCCNCTRKEESEIPFLLKFPLSTVKKKDQNGEVLFLNAACSIFPRDKKEKMKNLEIKFEDGSRRKSLCCPIKF